MISISGGLVEEIIGYEKLNDCKSTRITTPSLPTRGFCIRTVSINTISRYVFFANDYYINILKVIGNNLCGWDMYQCVPHRGF